MIGIYVLLMILMFLNVKYLKNKMKLIVGVIIILITAYIVILNIDINRVNTNGLPIFVIKKEESLHEDIYYGIGYKTITNYTFINNEKVINSRELSFFNKILAGTIIDYVDTNNEYTYYKIDITSLDNTSISFTITDNNKDNVYGEWYRIDSMQNNDWIPLKPIIDDYGFNEIAYLLDDNKQVKFNINWEWLYGNLDKGRYRLVKEVKDKYIYIPFEIE